MKKIKKVGNREYGTTIDYILEDGTKLYACDWDGEKYVNGIKENGSASNKTYIPVCKYQLDNIDAKAIKEFSDEWLDAYKVLGFEEE